MPPDNKRTRRAGGGFNEVRAKSLDARTLTDRPVETAWVEPVDTSDTDRHRRRNWARRMMDSVVHHAPVARYGSAAWHALPEGDRRRVVAVIIAAECWVAAEDDMVARLRREVADGRAAGVRHLASVPTCAELSDRRGEPDRAARAR